MATNRVGQSSMATTVQQLPQLLDRPTLAGLLGTSERHVRRLVAERRIPFIRVGRFIRFEPSATGRWLEERRRGRATSLVASGYRGPNQRIASSASVALAARGPARLTSPMPAVTEEGLD